MQKVENEIEDDLDQAEDLSVATHSKYEYKFIIFNPRLHKAGFCGYLNDEFDCWSDITSKRLEELSEESVNAVDFFERFKAEYPQLKFKKFYSVTKPIKAELWGYEDPDEEDES